MEKLVYFTAIFLVVVFLPIPIMLNEMRRGTGAYRAVLEGIIAVGIATMLLFILSMAAGEPVGQTIENAGSAAIQNLVGDGSFAEALGLGQLSTAEQETFLSAIYVQSSHSIPAFILICASIISYFEYKLLTRMKIRAGKQVNSLPKFREFSMPRTALFGWCLILVLTYVINMTSLVADDILLANVESLFLFIFSVQGLAAIFMFFYVKRLPTVLAVIAAVFILGTTVGELLVFMLGLLDLTFHFKDRLLLNNKR